jgi:hypothetical protein
MTPTRGRARAGADKRNQLRGLHIRSRGGHAVGSRIIGVSRAREPQRCECSLCRIRGEEFVYEVVTHDDLVLEACVECMGVADVTEPVPWESVAPEHRGQPR